MEPVQILHSLAMVLMLTAPHPCFRMSSRLTLKIASLEVTTVFKHSPPRKMNFVHYAGFTSFCQAHP